MVFGFDFLDFCFFLQHVAKNEECKQVEYK